MPFSGLGIVTAASDCKVNQRPLCAPIPDVRALRANARKRTGSFAPVKSTANVRLWVGSGLRHRRPARRLGEYGRELKGEREHYIKGNGRVRLSLRPVDRGRIVPSELSRPRVSLREADPPGSADRPAGPSVFVPVANCAKERARSHWGARPLLMQM